MYVCVVPNLLLYCAWLQSEKAHGIKCGTFGASSIEERHLSTGDYAGQLNIWYATYVTNAASAADILLNTLYRRRDLERLDVPAYSTQAHSSIVNAIDGCGGLGIGGGAPEIVTGGRDGCVRLWDPRINEPVLALEPSEGQQVRDCWTVAFGNAYNDEERCIVAGYDNGDVKLFDLRTNTLRYETNVGNGVSCKFNDYDESDSR